MKKMIALLMVILFALVYLVFAQEAQKELRPMQKIMQARIAFLGGIGKNLEAKQFDLIAKNANELATETQKTAEKLPNALAKEITLAVSSLSDDISKAAAKKDGETVKIKLGEIKAKCGECHAKIRDKK